MQDCKHFFKETRTCVIVPTYNNQGTVVQVIERIQPYIDDILVVNDGSTDDTERKLAQFGNEIMVVSHSGNKGKGCALKTGFRKAQELGFRYAITIDSDGQHYPEDLPLFAEALQKNPGALIVGNRKLHQKNMPGGNTFANYFSNFWFMLQTWQYLPDTQTGYRLYPLNDLYGLDLLTSRYEAELELLVAAAWNGVSLVSMPIRVYYPPSEERVSHFRPFYDFGRISVLNTILCILCVCFGWWSIIVHKILTKRIRRKIVTCLYLAFAFVSAILWPLPAVCLFRIMWPHSDVRKRQYHRLLCGYFRFLLRHIPGVNTYINNPGNEQFSKPAIIISNHQSHLDLLSILSLSPNMVALTNQWVWDSWIYAPVLRYLDYYPATYGVESSEEHFRAVIERGYSVVIFPEGTRSEDCSILKFHRGAFYMAEKLGADIVPIYLEGPGEVTPKKDAIINRGRIRITIGQRVDSTDTSTGTNYREKTRFWHKHYLSRLMMFCILVFSAFQVMGQTARPKHLYEYRAEVAAEGEKPAKTAIVVCPGGSYSWLDKKTEGHDVARWLQQEGVNAYVLYYRVQGGFAFASGYRFLIRGHQYPDAQNDLRQTILWLRENADSLGIDPNRIGAMGFSAGGHLVASAGELFETQARPDFIVPVYPVVTLSQKPFVHKRSRRALLGEYRKHSKRLRDSLSLELHVNEDMPPVFLVNCKDDPIVHYHNSELLDSALSAHGISHRYLQFNSGGHGFGQDSVKAGNEAIAWKAEFIKWLKDLK